jgi:hypothetical protein
MWASCQGHADIARVLVEHGASLEAVNKVNIHAHALAYTCCIKDVSVIMRMTMIFIFIIICHVYIIYYSYIYIYSRKVSKVYFYNIIYIYNMKQGSYY